MLKRNFKNADHGYEREGKILCQTLIRREMMLLEYFWFRMKGFLFA